MARRERDRDERAQGGGPRGAGQRQGGRAKGAAPQRRPNAPEAPRSIAEDPNAYRSPGFQDLDQSPYKIDYAGLPRDVEEDEEQTEAPAPQAPARTPVLPRGMLGRNQDRRGTDPNAYRSPAFQDLDRLHQRFGARRRGGPPRPSAPVRPEGAPADIEDPELPSPPPEADQGS